MTTHEERKLVIVLLNESVTAGARRAKACEVLGLSGGESLFLSKDFPCSQHGNPQKYRDKFKLLRKPQPSCSP